MKQLLILLISLLIISCSSKPLVKSEFSDKAELRRFKVENNIHKTSSGYFFLFFGSYQSNEQEVSTIKFYAKNKLDEYCLFECPPKCVKIALDSTVINAHVAFRYNEPRKTDSLTYNNINWDLLNQIWEVSAIITCNPKDFPENINLDQL